MKSYVIIGLMDGTSMDGLDIAYCSYSKGLTGSWTHQLLEHKTVKHPTSLLTSMKESKTLLSEQLLVLDKELAQFYAEAVNSFISENEIDPNQINAIASHGHTVFHQPEKGYTLQIGCGETLAYHTGITVINNFRQKDVAAGGQGAPLVPIGDKLLFFDRADSFLNIGGFTNVTFLKDRVEAFDICPGNLPMNRIANELNEPFDRDGQLAASGEVNQTVLNKLNSLGYYGLSSPRSLGTEWLDNEFMPILSEIANPNDRIRTCVEHIAEQVSAVLNGSNSQSTLVTGGGAFNTYLIEKIREKSNSTIIMPEKEVIEYKEAIVFGFLAALNLENSINILSSVTGASKDVIGGVRHLP